MLLAIDTSTSWASLALFDASGVLARRAWQIGQMHSVEILGAIDALLSGSGAARGDIRAVAVATGPGSFNGTRVAVTAAKTLAFVWSVPLVGVTTLDAIAQAGGASAGVTIGVLEAGRGELYAAVFDHVTLAGQGWYDVIVPRHVAARRGDIAVLAPDALIALARGVTPVGPVLIVGEMSDEHRMALVTALGERVRLAEPLSPPDRAVGLGEIALARLAAGESDDPLALEPAYVRHPNITTSARHPLVAPDAR